MIRWIALTAVMALTPFMPTLVHAQTGDHKFEVGGQFSLLSVQTHAATGTTVTTKRKTVTGIGGRFGYNFSSYVGIEAETNFFWQDREIEGGKKLAGLFGLRAGKRFDRFGVFAKGRPGFIRFEKGDYRLGTGGCPTVFPPPIGCFRSVARTYFAFDVGGVVEFYPSRRTIIRLDAGDTIIRFGDRKVAASSDVFAVPVVFAVPARTTHNFQGSIGFGLRF